MQLADFFEDVVVLSAQSSDGARLQQRLQQRGCTPWSLELDAQGRWRDTLGRALAQARSHRAPGVLVLLPRPGDDAAFWRSQDPLVEHLAGRRWDIVYLGHGEGQRALEHGDRPGLVHCDMPPNGISAVAVSCDTLQMLLHTMPDHGVDGPLSAADWLTIACWLAAGRMGPDSGWVAWPPLMH